MTNTKKKTAPAPQLRFPGFEGEWEEKKLGEICTILNNLRRPITGSQRVKGNYPYYGASGIVDYVAEYIFDEPLLLVGEDGAKWGRFEKTAFIAEGKYWVNNHAHVLKPIDTPREILANYLSMLDLAPFVTGAAPPKLTLGKLKSVPIPLPPNLPEQPRIAAALSSLDAVITAHQSKLEALRQHKRGLMAGLFPAEGEKVPRLRFPEFEGSGEWEEKKLGEVATFLNGRAYAQDELLAEGKYKVLRVGNFFSSNSWYYSDLELDETKYCEPGDLLYAWSASFGPRIWKEPKAIFHYHIWKVITKKGNNLTFVFYMLDKITDEMKASLKNGLGIFHITKSGIESWVVSFPPTLPEQQRIAACLSSLDDLMTAQQGKIAVLQEFKRGLMQGLFPSTDTAPQEAAE